MRQICGAKLVKGGSCKRKVTNGRLCYTHRVTSMYLDTITDGEIPLLPREMWDTIFSYLGLEDRGRIHLVCKYFYKKVRQEFSTGIHRYILLDHNGINVRGNDLPETYKFFSRPRNSLCEYIINDIVQPMGVKKSSIRPNTEPLPLLSCIKSYNEFVATIGTIVRNKYVEDKYFPYYTGDDGLEKTVIEYTKRKKIDTLVREINVYPPRDIQRSLRHKLSGIGSSYEIKWTNCPDVIRRVADKLRQTYPTLKMIIVCGHISYTLTDFTQY